MEEFARHQISIALSPLLIMFVNCHIMARGKRQGHNTSYLFGLGLYMYDLVDELRHHFSGI